jgi:hypothetical protein
MKGEERATVKGGTDVDLAPATFRLLLTTQAVFFAALAWCVVLDHGEGVQDAGISFFGVHARTILLVIVGYGAATIGLWRASTMFKAGGLDPLIWLGVRVVAVTLVVLLATPYTGGAFLNWAHMTTGVTGALVQLSISWSLVRHFFGFGAVTGFVVQLLGGMLAALSLPDWHFQYLLTAEILMEIGFSWCLLEWTQRLASPVGD